MFKFVCLLFFLAVQVIYLTSGSSQSYEDLKDALPNRPPYKGVMEKHINAPELQYEPNLESSKGLVYYQLYKDSMYEKYIKRLDSVLTGHDRMAPSEMVDCGPFSEYKPLEYLHKSCRLDVHDLGFKCSKEQHYGFRDARPCFAISMDRILNWLPEPYTNETVPDKIRGNWNQYSVTVHCEGEDPVSKDNIGDISYHPEGGIHFKYFPNTGRADWVNPFMFVQLENPMAGIAIRVTCSAYAKNIMHSDKLNTGKVSFDLMID